MHALRSQRKLLNKISIFAFITVGFALAFLPASLFSQCAPPAGTYKMGFKVSPNPVSTCPGNTFTIDVIADASPGGLQLSGFGLNVAINANVPITILSVNPVAYSPPTGFFSSTINGNEFAAIGGDVTGSSIPGPITLARAIVQVSPVSAPTVWSVDFSGTTPLIGGFIPLNHLVEGSTGCDVVSPLLGLSPQNITALTCAGNFIRGDCNNNGLILGLIGDPLYILHFLFTGGPAPQCDAACDSNFDDTINITDATYLFNWMVGIGPPPPSPFALCGPPPPGQTLTCANHICP